MTSLRNRWFGSTYTRWPVRPLRTVARLGTGHTPSRSIPAYWENCTIPWVTVEDIRREGEWALTPLQSTEQKISEIGLANSAAVLHPAGTVMLSRTASIGLSCIVGKPMATTQAFVTWTPDPRSMSGDYLLAALKAMGDQYHYLAYGAAHLTVYFPDIKTLQVPVPPLDVQTKIVAFLREQTAKIDALVAEQEQLIELLQEKRQAVISHAVTKGLNPDAPMKDSGIEWLGEIPAHWDLGALGRYASVLPGYAFPSNGYCTDESATRLLRGVNVGVGELRWDDAMFWRRNTDDGLEDFVLRVGDLVVGMDRPLIADGMRVALVEERDEGALLVQRVACVRTGVRISPKFACHLLTSPFFVAHFSPETTGVSVPHISGDQIEAFRVPVPPINEQHQITSVVSDAIGRFDELLREARRSIALLVERRAALISAAVTGQIDVRSANGGAA